MLATLLLMAGLSYPMIPAPAGLMSYPPVLLADSDAADTPSLPMQCVYRQQLVDHLKTAGGEPLFVGVGGQSFALEVWRDSNDPNDPWIAFLTLPNGGACIVAHGLTLGFADPAHPRPVQP